MSYPASRLLSPGSTRTLRALVSAMRPHQWVKNLLVPISLVFAQEITSPEKLACGFAGFVIFCLASSAIYLFNDVRDRKADQRHPEKRARAIAAGELSVRLALTVSVVLGLLALLAAMIVGRTFALVVMVFLLQNVAYSLFLKRISIIDVMTIAVGFVLRGVGGAFAILAPVSPWQLLCTMMLALLVAVGKRRHELSRDQLEGNATNYSAPYLDMMMSMAGAAAVVTYSLYCLSDHILLQYKSHTMVLTVPMVIYGVFRFMYLVLRENKGSDPSRLFVTDVPLLVNAVVWVSVVCFAIYGPTEWLPWWRVQI